MKQQSVFFSLLSLTVAAISSEGGSVVSYIIGGTIADEHEIPYQVLLTSSSPKRNTEGGGSLIAAEWVLTAAHCIDMEADQTRVLLGGIERRFLKYKKKALLRIQHMRYNDSTYENDIGLLKIRRPEASLLKFVTLATADIGSLVGDTARMSGYGVTSAGGKVSKILWKVDQKVISKEDCEKSYGLIDDTMICTTHLENPGQAPCDGDSGGPLVLKRNGTDIQIGIDSFRHKDGCTAGPIVYTRVSEYTGWIERIMRNNP